MALARGGWIDEKARAELEAAYCFLRVVENRLQMLEDEQIQTLPSDRERLAGFARFLGFADRDAFADGLLAHLRNVPRHYAALFENVPSGTADRRPLALPDAERPATLDRLAGMGFRQPSEIVARLNAWRSGTYRSLKGSFARGQLAELVGLLLSQFARSANPDAAFAAFDRFIADLRGGRLFALLRRNPELIALLLLVLETAPRLAESLAQFPEMMQVLSIEVPSTTRQCLLQTYCYFLPT